MTQTFPDTDLFAANGDNWAQAAEASTTDPCRNVHRIYITEGLLAPGNYHLWSAFFGSPGGPVGKTTRVAVCSPFGGPFVYRPFVDDDCEVSMSFRVQGWLSGSDVPSSTSGWLRWRFVLGARVQDWTITTTTMTDPSGYWFSFTREAGVSGAMKWRLYRTNGSTETELDSETLSDLAALQITDSREMRMRVETTAGNVRIRCYSTLDGLETEIFDVTDSSGSKITDNGRCSFEIGGVKDWTASSVTHYWGEAVEWFQITNLAGDVQFRDEWRRIFTDNSAVPNDIHPHIGTTVIETDSGDLKGFHLDCHFGTDAGGTVDLFSTGVHRLLWDSASSEAYWAASASDVVAGDASKVHGYPCLRKSTSNVYHDRRLLVRFMSHGYSASTTTRMAAVGVRVSAARPADSAPFSWNFKSGYFYQIHTQDSSGVGNVALIRRINNTDTLIAFKGSLTHGTSYKLIRLLVQNTGGTSATTGTVMLSMFLDGVQVVPTPFNGATVDTDGNIYDTSSDRILTGWGEGLQMRCPYAVTDYTPLISIDSWDVGSIIPPAATDDAASIEMSTECDGSTGTLSTPVDWPIEEVELYRIGGQRYDSGHTQRVPLSDIPRRAWKCTTAAATTSEKSTLLSFYASHNGCEVPFTWESPRDGNVTVRFRRDTLESALIAPGVHRLSFELEEAICP